MDRFIDELFHQDTLLKYHLKSNMDRFIAYLQQQINFLQLYLKSNMDRFIASTPLAYALSLSQFKIQYG